jgi:acyl carrier protein
MEVEESFDVRIEDTEAEKILTPRQLIDLVMSKVETTTTDVCLTHRSFNLLRGFFLRRSHLQRRQIKPDTSLHETILRVERRQLLQQLATDLAIPTPVGLVRPEWLKAMLFFIAVAAGLAAFACSTWYGPAAFPIAALALLATALTGVAVTSSWRTEFPKELRTMGQLARWVMTHKSDLANERSSRWTRHQIAARVREIVIKQLRCESSYREDAHFIKELGLG